MYKRQVNWQWQETSEFVYSIVNSLVIANTKFPHKQIHKWTRVEPYRNKKSVIDYAIVNQHSIKYVWDVKSDERTRYWKWPLFISNGEDSWKFKTIIKKKTTLEKIKSYKLEEKEIEARFKDMVEVKLAGLVESDDPEKTGIVSNF